MTSITTLALNGEAIPLKNMRVTLTQQFQDKDQSGQTSATTKSEQGVKGKELRVSGEIPFKSRDVLSRVFELATATDSSGQRQKYRRQSHQLDGRGQRREPQPPKRGSPLG